jgi:uncharacterized alpha-E superfamily protein
MLSRVANSIFWMSRYMERSNFLLRIVKVHYMGSQEDIQDFNWGSLLKAYGSVRENDTDKSLQQILDYLILERENVASVFNNITKARENARAIQDHITKEVWQVLNDYYHLIRETNIRYYLSDSDPVTALDTLNKQSVLYYGTVETTMARGEGFDFLNIGKLLERALQNTWLLLFKLSTTENGNRAEDAAAWRYFLLSLCGYELYLKTNSTSVQPNFAIQQAIQNIDFPHSLIYCIQRINRYFQRLKPDSPEESFKQMDFDIGRTAGIIKYSELKETNKESLIPFVNQVRGELFNIAKGFNKHYFGQN